MKKATILIILLSFSFNTYAFWVWSPKTQKWKNPQYSALATPFLQYKEALKFFERADYERAYKAFRKLLATYPDSKEAADSQYYEGRCLEEMGKPFKAFQAYQKVIDSYPNSKRINEVVEREYKIGEYYLNRESKEWLGLSWYDFVEHPAVIIFQKIVKTVPYSEYAPLAQYKLGMLFFKIARYDEARDSFQKVIDNYPDSQWAEPSKYQLAIATARASYGVGYDSQNIEEATERLKEFVKEHPEAEISAKAEEQLRELKNKEAEKNFDIAKFYEKQRKYSSALTYYKIVVNRYDDSDYYTGAKNKVEELTLLLDTGFTKKELSRERKRVLQQERRAEEQRLREERERQLQEEREQAQRLKEEQLKAVEVIEEEEVVSAGSEQVDEDVEEVQVEEEAVVEEVSPKDGNKGVLFSGVGEDTTDE